MEPVTSFFSHPFFIYYTGISTVYIIGTVCYAAFLGSKGVFHVLLQLGRGLSKRKIAVFADEQFDDLKEILVDSQLFQEKNIIQIRRSSIKKAKDISLLLVHWQFSKDFLKEILAEKKDEDALIVYAPQDGDGRIDDVTLKMINNNRNAIIVNFRGRLLNDVFNCMVTTGCLKK